MSKIINGRALASQHQQILAEKIRSLGLTPCLVSFCNVDDPPSVKYTEMKAAKAREVGINFITEEYSTGVSRDFLAEKIQGYDDSDEITGIMVQLPVPEHLVVFQTDLLNLIDPKKDVDGLTEKGRKIYLPATAKGVVSILEFLEQTEDIRLAEQLVAVVGAEGEVGKPLVEALLGRVKEIFRVDKKNGPPDLAQIRQADIVISATGVENVVTAEMVKMGVIAIDVGLGDFEPGVYQKARLYTPRIGGVGPMTVISLMENVIKAAETS